MQEEKIKEGLTFDDVLILPAKTDVIPAQAEVATRLSRNITLNIPIISAAMDTVTESKMAIDLAHQGGIGIIARHMTSTTQAEEVDNVKHHDCGMRVDPIPHRPCHQVFEC